MNEYLGVYDEEFIQLHSVKIRANTEEEAEQKFLVYLEARMKYIIDSKFYVVSLFSLETI